MHPDLEDPPNYDATFLRGVKQVKDLALAMDVFAKGLRVAGGAGEELAKATKKARKRRRASSDYVFRDPLEVAEEQEGEEERLIWAQMRSAFARDQIASGSPYLFNLATIRLWGILEATVDDGAAELIETRDELRKAEVLKRVAVPFLEFASADERERSQVVVRAVKEEVGASKQNGVLRFESLLKPLGLAGPYEKGIEKTAKELSGIRHVLVHRDGVIDDRLLNQCPWMKLNNKRGEKVGVTGKSFHRYSQTAEWLLLEYHRRLVAFDGAPEDSDRISTQVVLAAILNDEPMRRKWPSKGEG